MNDSVSHPAHYTFGKFEVIDVLENWFPNDPLLWQVGKYLARAGRKENFLEDLQKAQWYLSRKIAQLEGKKEEKKEEIQYRKFTSCEFEAKASNYRREERCRKNSL